MHRTLPLLSAPLFALLFALLLAPLLLAPGAAAEEEKDPAPLPLESRVNRAIDRSAAHLVKKQHEDGSWQKEDKVHPLGRTALCTFALLHAGYPKDHPAVAKALAFLKVSEDYGYEIVPHSTYEAGCLALMLNALGKRHGRAIRVICQWLCDHFNANAGLWGYPDGIPDMSNTQYAALALKVGARHGFETPDGIWKRLIDTVLRLQSETGGIRYRGGTMYHASMTHAGLLVLKFATEGLRMRRPKRAVREAMEKATQWLEAHYDVVRHPTGRGWMHEHYYYYMYGLERYAVLFGLETIAGHDWYREGAEELLARQHKDGSWGNLERTCFAILFLRRATLTEPDGREVGDADPESEKEGKEEVRRPVPNEHVPYLQDWLVAGPFAGTQLEDDHLFLEHLDPKRVTPRAGASAGKRRWRHWTAPDPKVDLGVALGADAWSSFYAAVYLHAEAETDALLWLASDDGLRAYLNGEEILFGHHHNYSGDDFYRVEIHLEKGRNLLLLHVENLEYYVYFRARLTDLQREPLAGVFPSVFRRAPRR